MLAGLSLDALPDKVAAQAVKVLLDGASIYMLWKVGTPSLGKAEGPLSRCYPLMFPVGDAIGLVSKTSTIAFLKGDVATLGRMTRTW